MEVAGGSRWIEETGEGEEEGGGKRGQSRLSLSSRARLNR